MGNSEVSLVYAYIRLNANFILLPNILYAKPCISSWIIEFIPPYFSLIIDLDFLIIHEISLEEFW